jgi:hypothetical protein
MGPHPVGDHATNVLTRWGTTLRRSQKRRTSVQAAQNGLIEAQLDDQ